MSTSRARGNLVEGAVTLVTGLALRLFADDVRVPVVTLTSVGVVMMCVGGALVTSGLWQVARSRT
ncbi:DUF5708 family protein [Streptomyces sp. NPDC007808]|uniref:DUF5708 family protein n=1 Tax=Streptomyces sp. NPDC007808 TaxID=3364779 RepID=UPI0036B5A7CB